MERDNPDNIKPCPFCGQTWEADELAIECDGFYQGCYRVICSNGHKGKWVSGSREVAIKDWNRRIEK